MEREPLWQSPLSPVAAMRSLINSLPEGRERLAAVEACIALSFRLWGWNVERFRDELSQVVTGKVVNKDLSDRSADT